MRKILIALGLLTATLLMFGGEIVGKIRKIGPRYDNLLPELKDKIAQLEERAALMGLPIMFWDGWRDPAEAQANIDRGVSFIKDPYNSMHVWGLAVDYVKAGPGGVPEWPEASDPFWQALASLYESVGMEAGARWAHFDGAHAQLKVSLSEIRRGYGKAYVQYITDNSSA